MVVWVYAGVVAWGIWLELAVSGSKGFGFGEVVGLGLEICCLSGRFWVRNLLWFWVVFWVN